MCEERNGGIFDKIGTIGKSFFFFILIIIPGANNNKAQEYAIVPYCAVIKNNLKCCCQVQKEYGLPILYDIKNKQ